MAKRNPHGTVEDWNRLARRYLGSFLELCPRYGHQVERILEEWKTGPAQVLEVAAFSGKDSRYLASQFPDSRFYTADLSHEAVARARQANVSAGLSNLHAVRADAFRLPFADRSFDISFSADFYVYFGDGDIRRLLAEQKRVTKGRVVVFVHHRYNAYRLVFWCRAWAKGQSPWYNIRAFTLKDMRGIFEGERIVGVGGIDSWVVNLANTVGSGFLGRPVCPRPVREWIGRTAFFRKPLFWEIVYIVVEAGGGDRRMAACP